MPKVPHGTPPLRRVLCALSVAHDVDLVMSEAGAALAGPHTSHTTWRELARTIRGITTFDDQQAVLWQRLTLHSTIASLGDSASAVLRTRLRAMSLPPNHPLHPGKSWVHESVPGGGLDRGLGVHGIGDSPDTTLPLPADLAALAGINTRTWWTEARGHAEDMAGLMMSRITRDGGDTDSGRITLRPMGGVDVLGLLGTGRMRRSLVSLGGLGTRIVAAPTRTRGWVDMRHIDPAFVPLAADAADVLDVGCVRPLLLTAGEVSIAPAIPDPGSLLKNRVVDLRPWERSYRYR